MSDFDDAMADANAAVLETLGIDITYIPYVPENGATTPIAATCFLKKPSIDQSTNVGYFADIDVDPLVIPHPKKRDVVVWGDGVRYVVKGVINPPRGLMTLTLHRETDRP